MKSILSLGWTFREGHQLDELQRRINEQVVKDFDAELMSSNLQDFRKCFTALTPTEQAEALQCLLKSVVIQPNKLTLEVFELPGFIIRSKNRKDWLLRRDSNPRPGG